jgi:hypothetical protein
MKIHVLGLKGEYSSKAAEFLQNYIFSKSGIQKLDCVLHDSSENLSECLSNLYGIDKNLLIDKDLKIQRLILFKDKYFSGDELLELHVNFFHENVTHLLERELETQIRKQIELCISECHQNCDPPDIFVIVYNLSHTYDVEYLVRRGARIMMIDSTNFVALIDYVNTVSGGY